MECEKLKNLLEKHSLSIDWLVKELKKHCIIIELSCLSDVVNGVVVEGKARFLILTSLQIVVDYEKGLVKKS